MLAANYPFLDGLWTMVIFFVWVLWFWLLFTVFVDIFRRTDLSGWGKVGWLIFTIVLPYLGVFIYLISRREGMAQGNRDRPRSDRAPLASYVRETAGSGGAAADIE